MTLTRENIFSADDHKLEEIEVPEWGGSVFVKTFSGTVRDEIETAIYSGKKKDTTNFRARVVVASCCDENGTLLFSSDDVPQLGTKSASALQRVFDKAVKLNGMSPEDVDELEKN